MEAIEIIKLGRDMRAAQKRYFRTRTTTDLKASKHLESVFDKEVDKYLNPNNQLCFENFNTSPMAIFDQPLEKLNPDEKHL